ncbi:Hypothetical predicted protein [Olea europaea subsp. europaea]|uniref:Uncharacterized protein n=1 Tax=Olea europaea subsp. europaea TaxID=158383 RepID=A0A8S0RCN8_OLEEU|nr:Hypothetical predicted protein [Olea europaea subsp. europaea]
MAETRSKSNEEHLKKLDKEISDLGMAFKSSDQILKVVYTKQDRMVHLMGEMNSKYESIVSMLAHMNGGKVGHKEKQVEGYSTSSQTSSDIPPLGSNRHLGNTS